jgi:predicted enzyme related to lactoylglutathione lyase
MATFVLTMLVSKDLVRSRDFYRDELGLKLGVDAPPHWVDFDLGNGVLLGIHPADDKMEVTRSSILNGFAVDDVDAFIVGVKSRGIPVVQEPHDETFGRIALILDPDGYVVQVYKPAHVPATPAYAPR